MFRNFLYLQPGWIGTPGSIRKRHIVSVSLPAQNPCPDLPPLSRSTPVDGTQLWVYAKFKQTICILCKTTVARRQRLCKLAKVFRSPKFAISSSTHVVYTVNPTSKPTNLPTNLQAKFEENLSIWLFVLPRELVYERVEKELIGRGRCP